MHVILLIYMSELLLCCYCCFPVMFTYYLRFSLIHVTHLKIMALISVASIVRQRSDHNTIGLHVGGY